MGKRILTRRRGRGGIQFRSLKKGKIAPVKYPFFFPSETKVGKITDILNERGRSAPLAQVKFENGKISYLPAIAGLPKGAKIEIGADVGPKLGNILPLANIPEGTSISNIERRFGDGGKFMRSSGTAAILFSKSQTDAIVKLRSGKKAIFKVNCRATIGAVAGGGRPEKPFLRAGARYHSMKAKGKQYPRVRGVAMAAVYHPHGGGRHQHPGGTTSVPRSAPPGRKVGNIAPRKTGRGGKTRAG